MGGGRGLPDGFVLPNDCWVQRGEGLLNKTLSTLTCGLVYSILGKCKTGEETLAVSTATGSGVVPQREAPRAHTLLETMFKALGQPRWDHGWGWWK